MHSRNGNASGLKRNRGCRDRRTGRCWFHFWRLGLRRGRGCRQRPCRHRLESTRWGCGIWSRVGCSGTCWRRVANRGPCRCGSHERRRRDPRLRSESVLGLSRRRSGRPRAQLFARGLARPGAWIDFPHDVQPFFSFGERREISHVEAKALTTFFEPATHEKSEPLELGQIRLCERHRCRRRTQIENERARIRGGRRRVPYFRALHGAGCQIWRW
ncbi:MAG: hypothetical protein JWN85_3833 [Gammaproteobacteria bacterium]|nr:hypothetical protein [Gammaproteobacteria bacterium]